MNTSRRRWSGLALAVLATVCGLLLQLCGFPLVGSQSSGGVAIHYVSWVLVALLFLTVLGVVLMVWPRRDDSDH